MSYHIGQIRQLSETTDQPKHGFYALSEGECNMWSVLISWDDPNPDIEEFDSKWAYQQPVYSNIFCEVCCGL